MSDKNVPDPHGNISRIKSRLPANCAIKTSPFCEYIIAMRMQGIAYLQIEKWLIEQGKQYRISAPTLWRNFDATKIQVELPLAEELKERFGGKIDLDLANELSNQIFLQRRRIDHLIREESKVQQSTNPKFSNKLIRGEMETLNNLIRTLGGMLENPMKAVEERAKADQLNKSIAPDVEAVTGDAAALITELILDGEVKVDAGAVNPTPVN